MVFGKVLASDGGAAEAVPPIMCGYVMCVCAVDGWVDGWMDGCMDGGVDGWVNGWVDDWVDG